MLTALLTCPTSASSTLPARQPVWHFTVRTELGEMAFTHAEWRHAAEEILHETGMARRGDPNGCRWIALHGGQQLDLLVNPLRGEGSPLQVHRTLQVLHQLVPLVKSDIAGRRRLHPAAWHPARPAA